MFNGQALQKIFRCNAGPSREEPMKMEWAQLSVGRELVEIGLVRVMSIQKSDHICDSFVIIHTGTLSSLETPAHPLLAAIFESFRGKGFGQLVRMTSLSCCTSASLAAPSSWVTPNHSLNHLRADLMPSLVRRGNVSIDRLSGQLLFSADSA